MTATDGLGLTGPFDAASLVGNLREGGLVTEQEYREHASLVEELLRTLKHEPLQFEDCFAMALIEGHWTPAECWFLARKAAREVPSKAMREALERELQDAYEWIEDLKRTAILRQRSTPEERRELLEALAL